MSVAVFNQIGTGNVRLHTEIVNGFADFFIAHSKRATETALVAWRVFNVLPNKLGRELQMVLHVTTVQVQDHQRRVFQVEGPPAAGFVAPEYPYRMNGFDLF